MATFCPNKNSKEFRDLQKALGNNESLARVVWQRNNGNPMNLTRGGKESILFKSLLDSGLSYENAIKVKANTYLSGFTTWFGKWYENTIGLSEFIDENGEPMIMKVPNTSYINYALKEFSNNRGENQQENRDKVDTFRRIIAKDTEVISGLYNHIFGISFTEEIDNSLAFTPVFVNSRSTFDINNDEHVNLLLGLIDIEESDEARNNLRKTLRYNPMLLMPELHNLGFDLLNVGGDFSITTINNPNIIRNIADIGLEKETYPNEFNIAKYSTDDLVQEMIEKVGYENVTNWNNPYSKELTKRYGLDKPFNSYDEAVKASRIVRRKEGLVATRIHKVTGTKKLQYLVEVGANVNRQKYSQDVFKSTNGISYAYKPEDHLSINSIREKIKSGEIQSVYDLIQEIEKLLELDEFKNNSFLHSIFNIIKNNEEAFKIVNVGELKGENSDDSFGIFVTRIDEKKDGSYTVKVRTLNLNFDLFAAHPNLELFITVAFHEIIHGFSNSALKDPSNNIERKFKNDVESIFAEVKKLLPNSKVNGLTNPSEFLSDFLSNEYFAYKILREINKDNEAKQKTDSNTIRGFFHRMLDAILKLFRFNRQKDNKIYPRLLASLSSLAASTNFLRNDFSSELSNYIDKSVDGPAIMDFSKVDENAKEFIDDIHKRVKTNSRESYIDTLKYISDAVVLDDEKYKHKYVNTAVTDKNGNPVVYDSTHDFMVRNGLYRASDGKEEDNDFIKSGNAIHMFAESFYKKDFVDFKKIFAKTGYSFSEKAKESLSGILNDLIPEGATVLSEVTVFDHDKKLAGTIDLVIIDKVGRVMLFDFKTSYNKFRNYVGDNHRFVYNRDRYRFQLSTYKHMLEKLLDKKVTSMNIVMLDVNSDFSDKRIESVDRYTLFKPDGIDTSFQETDMFTKAYGEPQRRFQGDVENAFVEDKQNADESFFDTSKFKTNAVINKQINVLDKLIEKVSAKFERNLEILRKRYSYSRRAYFEKFMEELRNQKSSSQSLLLIVRHTANMINKTYGRYKELVASGSEITIRDLQTWYEFAASYDILEEIQAYVLSREDVFKDPSFISLVQDAVSKKNAIKNLYKAYGKRLLARFLSKYYNGVRIQAKEEIEQDYRERVYKLKKKGYKAKDIVDELGTLGDFVASKYDDMEDDLDTQTVKLLEEQLELAEKDVGHLQRWIDNMLDTSDPVASAVVSAFVEADDKQRRQSYEKRIEVVEKLRALEKKLNKGSFQSSRDFYDMFLEKDEKGRPTGYLLSPWKNELLEEEKKLRQILNADLPTKLANSKLSAWRKENMSFNRVAFNEDMRKLMNKLYDQGILSVKELDILDKSISDTGRSDISIRSLSEQGIINDVASDILLGWASENRMWYYTLHEKWINPQWVKFASQFGIKQGDYYFDQMKVLEASDNPIAQFYVMLVKMASEANSALPSGYRLGMRLPGVTKTTDEMLKEGRSPIGVFITNMDLGLLLQPDDVERGNAEFVDENGRIKYFLPIHYTASVDPEKQSYDLAGIYFKFWSSANNYRIKKEILPELELARKFIEERPSIRRNILGKVIQETKGAQADKPKISEKRTQLAQMFADWFDMAVYGKRSTDRSLVVLNKDGSNPKVFDVSKFIDIINGYTSLNLLALNFVQAIANVAIGEPMEAIEAFAGEHINIKSFTKASAYYTAMLPKLLGNIGQRFKDDKLSLLIEELDILHETPLWTDFNKRTVLGQLSNYSTLFFLQHAGEHFMQSRFMLAMLLDKKAYNRKGEVIGNMLDQYYVDKKTHKLKINDEVDLVKSQWTENDRDLFKRKLKALLSRMHGEYSELGRVAIQQTALGRMAYMFRKFIVPGFKRRWSKSAYIERLGQTVEGNYISFGKFAWQLLKDIYSFKLSLMGVDWAKLSPHQKANVRRTLGEIAFLTAAIIIASMLYKGIGDTDDPDEKRILSFFAYQAYRLKAELLFFSPKFDETMSILRSPMASMSVVENTTRLLTHLLSKHQVYQRGPWKGKAKITKDIVNMIPLYRQYYRLRDIGQQVSWFKNTPGVQMNTGK